MMQEFQIGNFRIVQDEEGYGILRQKAEGVWEAIATFIYPEDAIRYFANIILEATAYVQNMENIEAKQEKE